MRKHFHFERRPHLFVMMPSWVRCHSLPKRLYTIWIYPETVGLFHILGTFKRLKGAYVRMCVRYRRQHDARKSLEIHRIEWRRGWESNCIPNLHRHAKTTGPGRHRWRSTDRHSDLCLHSGDLHCACTGAAADRNRKVFMDVVRHRHHAERPFPDGGHHVHRRRDRQQHSDGDFRQ